MRLARNKKDKETIFQAKFWLNAIQWALGKDKEFKQTQEELIIEFKDNLKNEIIKNQHQ